MIKGIKANHPRFRRPVGTFKKLNIVPISLATPIEMYLEIIQKIYKSNLTHG